MLGHAWSKDGMLRSVDGVVAAGPDSIDVDEIIEDMHAAEAAAAAEAAEAEVAAAEAAAQAATATAPPAEPSPAPEARRARVFEEGVQKRSPLS